jgi:hypothetical protein
LSGVGIVTPVLTPFIVADAQSSTKPHKAVLAAADPNRARLNNADHYARAKAGASAQLEGDDNRRFRSQAK